MKDDKLEKLLVFILVLVGDRLIIMWLWNWIISDLFDLSIITFWQAAGLRILVRSLIASNESTKE
jgi:hypothetical protein